MVVSVSSPTMKDTEPKLHMQQEVQGDQNQMIGQVLGGMVVYGTVNYNYPAAEVNSSEVHSQKQPMGANPYQGLLAFQETDGDRFFGRNEQIAALWEKFRSLHESEATIRLLIVYGPSGSGKSSLARAGLLPELARRPLPGRDRARVAMFIPGSHPLEALATVLARITTNDLVPVAKTREFVTELAEANAAGVYDGLRRIAAALPEIAISPLIVLVDQLEEVFTLCDSAAEREAFIGNLLCATADRSQQVAVIITLRSDFLGATQKFPRLNQLISQGFFVFAMAEEGLRQAIEQPAMLAGHPLDLSTVNLLIEQTTDREGALPLLQFALTRIWMGLQAGIEPAITLRTIGGVGGALAGEAQRIYQSLDTSEQEIARRVFLSLVQLGEGAKDTRRRSELQRIVSHRDSLVDVQRVISRFADPGARLITLAATAGAETVEVTHEALFEHWQQLKVWLDASRSDLRFQRRLDEAVVIWQDNGQPEGNLWRSPDLDLLRRYQERAGDDLTPCQLEFFQASIAAEQVQQQAKVQAAQEKKRQRQTLVGAMSTALVITSGIAVFALLQVQQVQRQRVKQLAVNAAVLLADNQTVDATINAIAAKGLSQSAFLQFPDRPQFAAADGSLLDVLQVNGEHNQFLHEDGVNAVAFSPDGQKIVTGSSDKKIRIWNAQTGQLIAKPLVGHLNSVDSVAFSANGQQIISRGSGGLIRTWDTQTGLPIGQPVKGNIDRADAAFSSDGQRMVAKSREGMVRIWDAKTGVPIGNPLKGTVEQFFSIAFSPDGQRLVSGSRDKTVQIWDVKTGEAISKPLEGHTRSVQSVAFSADGRWIVSGSRDNTIRIWDAKTGMALSRPFIGHTNSVNAVAFSPDGQSIVSASSDKTVRIWDFIPRTTISTFLQGYISSVKSVAFSPNGQWLVTAGSDQTVRIWNAQNGQAIGKPLVGHSAGVNVVAFSPDGQQIASGSSDQTIRFWNAQTGAVIGQPWAVHSEIKSLAFSPNGQSLVSGSTDGLIRLWAVPTGALLGKPLVGHAGNVKSVAFSSDGQRIASGGADGLIRLWDLQMVTGQPLVGHADEVNAVAFSPDGQRIASGSSDNSVRLWDAAKGTPIGKPLEGHTDDVNAVAFNPDGQRLVSGGRGHIVRIWDVGTGAPIGKPLESQQIVGNSGDNRVWFLKSTRDASTGAVINKSFDSLAESVNAVAFSPNGQRIVSGSDSQNENKKENTVEIWDLSWHSLLPLACEHLRYHPSLRQPTTDVAREAQQTCTQYVWSNEKS